MPTPTLRVRAINSAPFRPASQGAEYVLYWMTAFRRLGWNFARDHAVEQARALGLPLVILEPLRCDYPWASARFHSFVIDGMAEKAAALAGSSVVYLPYVEPSVGAGRGLLAALAERAALVVADEAPILFLPKALAAAGERLSVRIEAVDSNGLLPLRAADRVHLTAYSFRRFLQRELPNHLGALPSADPLADLSGPRATIRPELLKRWPMASDKLLAGEAQALSKLEIDASVGVVDETRGGERAAQARLATFLDRRFERYALDRNEVDDEVVSELSPYLHFGMISSHQIFTAIAERERWSPLRLAPSASGSREGWWGMSASAEAFLDQLVTWREVGFNRAWQCDDNQEYESLPDWARATLDEHAADPRAFVYLLEELESAQTHDEIWNAAQTQLVREGRIHNYLRMLWGKKILEWSTSPREALAAMIALNDKYALDGRDPNSYSGIFWCLGRYDRPWGPIRPIFGSIRYMSSDNTRRKLSLTKYLARYSPKAQGRLF